MPQPNRFVLFTAAFLAAITITVAAGYDEMLSEGDSWRFEYELLKEEISRLGESGGLARQSAPRPERIADEHARIWQSDRDPLDVILRRTKRLMDHIESLEGGPDLAELREQLLTAERAGEPAGLGKSVASMETERIAVFAKVSAIRRAAAFSNPLIDFDDILFVKHGEGQHSHMCDQYHGHQAYPHPGSGLFILEDAFTDTPRLRNICENSTIQNGRRAGEKIRGAFVTPDLSYDGTTIAFAATIDEPRENESRRLPSWQDGQVYEVFTVKKDGSDLTQLTDIGTGKHHKGPVNDFDPCWLPNGRIVFVSERRGGEGRCHHLVPTYTLYSMKPDGSDMYPISYHETNEWNPSVDNSGRIVYTRWDYIDRDSDVAHHLWYCGPDGSDPRSMHGNYPHPYTTLPDVPWYSSPVVDGRKERAWLEAGIRAIPESHKYVATASKHHGFFWQGSLIIIDQSIEDDGLMSQVTCLSPGTLSESGYQCTTGCKNPGGGSLSHAWPLSEEYFIATNVHNKGNKIVLVDVFGNRETIYESGTEFMPLEPIPVKVRLNEDGTPQDPIIPPKTFQGERDDPSKPRATISVVDVYESDFPLPEGVKIERLRIVQVIPRPWDKGDAGRNTATPRISLGTVPVEEDGSVYFEAPVGKAIYFQLLDEDGCAVHSMRSCTFVHPSEHLSCIGCHEDKWKTPRPPDNQIALRRDPSPLTPEVHDSSGITMIGYPTLVQPVFENTCVPCHKAEGKGLADMSYRGLDDYAFFFYGSGNGDIIAPFHGGSRTIPGYFGARYSLMGKKLLESHRDRVTDEEMKRVLLWLDGNSMEYGTWIHHNEEKEEGVKLVVPELDVDLENPTGVEYWKPLPGQVGTGRTSLKTQATSRGFGVHLVTEPDGSRFLINETGRSITVELYDSRGRKMYARTTSRKRHSIPLTGDMNAQGLYIARVRTQTEVRQFTVAAF